MKRQQIPLSRCDISQAGIQAVKAVLRGVRLTMGPILESLESAIAERAGRKFGIGGNSAASALHLCLRVLPIGPGDEVILPCYGLMAGVNAVLFERARPVLVRIDETYNADPSAVEAAVTDRTKAILPLAAYGNLAGFAEYEEIARRHGLALITDCSHALGSEMAGRQAGSFGDCAVFEFSNQRQLDTGDGGMIVTDCKDVRDLFTSMRNQGRDEEGGYFRHERMGYNYRLSEFNAAVSLAQHDRFAELLSAYSRIAAAYDEALKGVAGIHLPPRGDGNSREWFQYVVRLDDAVPRQRDSLLAELARAGIECGTGLTDLTSQPFVQQQLECRPEQFPMCRRLARRTVALPFYTSLTDDLVQRVVDCLTIGLRGPQSSGCESVEESG